MEEVQAQVAEQVKNTMEAGAKPLPLPPQLLLMRTSRAYLPSVLAYANPAEPITTAPFSTIEVRMVPENVTKSDVRRKFRRQRKWKSVSSWSAMERRSRACCAAPGSQKIRSTESLPPSAFRSADAAVAEGARLKLLFADLDGSGAKMTLARLSVYSGETLETNVAINDRGDYVQVTPPRRTAKRPSPDESDDSDDPRACGFTIRFTRRR